MKSNNFPISVNNDFKLQRNLCRKLIDFLASYAFDNWLVNLVSQIKSSYTELEEPFDDPEMMKYYHDFMKLGWSVFIRLVIAVGWVMFTIALLFMDSSDHNYWFLVLMPPTNSSIATIIDYFVKADHNRIKYALPGFMLHIGI